MDASIVVGLLTALIGFPVTWLSARATYRTAENDLLSKVDNRLSGYLDRLEETVNRHEATIQRQDQEIQRLRIIAGELRALTTRLLEELRRHDPTAADRIKIPDLPT